MKEQKISRENIEYAKRDFFLLDANNKKIIFLNHVKINLAIKNISPIHARIEDFNHETSFDTVICRSYASLSKIYINSKKNLKDKGIKKGMKLLDSVSNF